MSRLTEREIDLIREARMGSQEPVGAADVVQKAQSLRDETIGELLTRGTAAVASWTGLGAVARGLNALVLRPLRNALHRRTVITQLSRLDDHLLRDIGLERDMLESFGEALNTGIVEQRRQSEPAAGGIRQWLRRRRSIRELEALSDRQLADIGLLRAEIEGAVDRAIAEQSAKSARQAAARLTKTAVAKSRPAAEKPLPILPLWIGPWLAQPHNRHAA